MNLKFLAAAVAVCCLAACAMSPEVALPSVGRLYTYVRSNQDGSMAEAIYVYRASATRVEVGKIVSRCNNAAFVTAELDLEANQPSALVGGRIARDASQEPFAWLDYQSGALHARVPAMNLDVHTPIGHTPWRLYDFDLADLTALNAGRAPARTGFSFGVALIWPDGGSENPLLYLGQANAAYAGEDGEALVFHVSGALNGQLRLDADEGHVIEARFNEPNHTDYDNFQLTLQSVEDDAEPSWRGVRERHWANCPLNCHATETNTQHKRKARRLDTSGRHWRTRLMKPHGHLITIILAIFPTLAAIWSTGA